MLTIEMKINGTLIGQVYAHNKGYVDGSICKYDWHCYQMDMKGNPTITQGTLRHDRPDGFNKLAEAIFKELE